MDRLGGRERNQVNHRHQLMEKSRLALQRIKRISDLIKRAGDAPLQKATQLRIAAIPRGGPEWEIEMPEDFIAEAAELGFERIYGLRLKPPG